MSHLTKLPTSPLEDNDHQRWRVPDSHTQDQKESRHQGICFPAWLAKGLLCKQRKQGYNAQCSQALPLWQALENYNEVKSDPENRLHFLGQRIQKGPVQREFPVSKD